MLTLEEIKGEKLNGEQKSYLNGFFSGLQNRGFRFNDLYPDPATKGKPAADLENQTAEERIKRELDPLDAYPLLVEDSLTNRAPEKENAFRYKWNGLFFLTPNKEAYMCRLRIPGGKITSYQLRELARISQDLTSGYVQVTTRANIQLRLIEPKNAPELLHRIQTIGLHSRGSGADNIRNITANPTAGFDPHELIDVMPYVNHLAQLIINSREFYNLPRKFNIAFDGGGLIGSVEDTNDIGLKACKVTKDEGDIKPGIYFRVKLGGATGHKAFARDIGVLVKPEEVVKVTEALVRVFIANGDRTNRKKARLKHLLDKWTLEEYLTETERLLGYTLLRSPLDENGKSPLIEDTTLPKTPHSHVGIFPQKQESLNYLGVFIPVGELTHKQMIKLADLAEKHGSGDLRLTVWQNLVIPDIEDGDVEKIKKEIARAGLHWQQSNLRSGVIACTGNSFCKFASSNTKGHAKALADYLDKRVQLDRPINIHLTGCPHSCAQHYMGDIGLLGAKVKSPGGDSVEGYHVFVGGGFGENQAIGRQLFQGIGFEELKPTVEKMLKGYLRNRIESETFQQFAARHDLNDLQAIFSNDE